MEKSKKKACLMNDNMTYCKGKNCLLKESCILYLEGRQVNDSFRFMENCDPETRECYFPKN